MSNQSYTLRLVLARSGKATKKATFVTSAESLAAAIEKAKEYYVGSEVSFKTRLA